MIQLLAYVPIPMPMPIHSGCGTSTPFPPICEGFMIASFICAFLSVLMLIMALLVESVLKKTIPMYTMTIPLFLCIVCLGIGVAYALFGL